MAKKPSQQKPPETFEDALGELETLLREIEAGDVGLEQTLAKYERGNALIKHCRRVLNAAEKQIEELGRTDDGGLQATPAEEVG